MAWNNLTDAEQEFNNLKDSVGNLANSIRYLVSQINNHILNTGMDGFTGPISPTVKDNKLDFLQGPPGIQGPPGPQGIQGVPGDFREPWFDIELASAANPSANEIVLTYSQPADSPLILRDFLALGIDTAEAGKLAISGNIINGAGSSLNVQSNSADIQCYGYINLSPDESQIIVYIYGINTNLTYQSEEYSYALRGVQGPQGIPGPAPQVGTNGNWWYYDENVKLVDSGVPATGDKGDPGAVYTPDISFQPSVPGEFQVTWTGKDLNTIGPITLTIPQGEQGIQGPKGDKGDAAEIFRPEFSYTITAEGNTLVTATYTGEHTGDAIPFTYTVLRGAEGQQGVQGVQGVQGPYYIPVATVSYNSIGVNWLGSQSGMPAISTITITAPIGPQGAQGDKGDPGENLDEIVAGENIEINLSGDTPPKKIIEAPQVSKNTQDIATINDILQDRDKWGGVAGITYTPSLNQLKLINKDDTTLAVALPEVTVTYSGLMTWSDYKALISIYNRVDSLEEGGVWRGSYATYAALNAAYPNLDVSGTAWTVNDFIYIQADETQGGAQTAYNVTGTNGGTRTLQFTRVVTTPIATATNTSLGVVQGTASGSGKVYVETAGQMSVNGWDDLNATINNLNGQLTTKMDKPTGFPGTSSQLINGAGALQAIPTTLPPSGTAGGSLTGTYPNPGIVSNYKRWDIELVSPPGAATAPWGSKYFEADCSGLANADTVFIEFEIERAFYGAQAAYRIDGCVYFYKDSAGIHTYGYYTGLNDKLDVPSIIVRGNVVMFVMKQVYGNNFTNVVARFKTIRYGVNPSFTWGNGSGVIITLANDPTDSVPMTRRNWALGADLSSQAAAFGQSAQNGSATTWARSDHYHALPSFTSMITSPAVTNANSSQVTGFTMQSQKQMGTYYAKITGSHTGSAGAHVLFNVNHMSQTLLNFHGTYTDTTSGTTYPLTMNTASNIQSNTTMPAFSSASFTAYIALTYSI